jgi:hypothetical protein
MLFESAMMFYCGSAEQRREIKRKYDIIKVSHSIIALKMWFLIIFLEF